MDLNLATLDGKDTFNGMGLVESVTPAGSFSHFSNVKRLQKKKSASELIKDRRGVLIQQYEGSSVLRSFQNILPLNKLKVKDRL